MKQKSGPGKAPAEQVLKDIRRQTPPVIFSGKRRSASYWKACAVKRKSLSFAAARAALPRCITADPRSSWRPASAGWRAIRHAPRPPARSALKEVVADLTLENRPLNVRRQIV